MKELILATAIILSPIDVSQWDYLGVWFNYGTNAEVAEFARKLGTGYQTKNCPDKDVEVMAMKSGGAHIYGRCLP